jgi:hypothetical protein
MGKKNHKGFRGLNLNLMNAYKNRAKREIEGQLVKTNLEHPRVTK